MADPAAGSEEQQLALVSSGLILVEFWAPWCVVCETTGLLVEELVEQYAGKLKGARIDVEDHPQLAARFHIHAVPSLALVEDGQLVEQFAGFAAREKVQKSIDWALSRSADADASTGTGRAADSPSSTGAAGSPEDSEGGKPPA